jgi:DNA-binding SARP family transcriptional activator
VRVQVCVLGSTRAARSNDGGEPSWLDLGPRKPRAVLAALALTPGQPVPADQVADLVWAGEPPRAAHGALHAYISGLRKAGARSALETTDHGYVLRVPRADVDAHAFEDTVGVTERALAPLLSQLDGSGTAGWPDRGRVSDLVDGLDAALGTWGGEPYADLPDHPDVLAQRAGLQRVRGAAEELRLLGLLALGEHASVLSATEVTTALHPLRERLWAVHALALARAGRQAEALDALRRARAVLAEELGLDPGAELQHLEQAILRQEPGLHTVLPSVVAAAAAPAPARPVAAGGASVGRDAEREQLLAVLESARAGRLSAALLVGEPGIGKSRLVADLAEAARAQDIRVAVGRGSQDDGAPPFWPWLAVLQDLGRAAPEIEDEGKLPPGQAAFERRDAIAGEVLAAAAEHPVLVVLDDLHWADDASLRTLAHLLDTAPDDARLCVVGTRRTHPEPVGAYARAAESFARRHALRLDLAGLDLDEAAQLLRTVRPDVEQAEVDTWHERSGGNPFFLVELARLGTADPGEVPGTVRDVVTRRLEQLPEPARDTLRTAAVVGRRFHPEYVEAASDGADPDELADHLDAAIATGLLVEDPVDGAGQLAFSHALGRDAVYLTLPATRRARRHAQVAHALDTDPTLRRLVPEAERVAELARHWLAAGAAHSERAWRAARDAAAQARGLSDHVTAARLGVDAVAAHRRSGAEDAERFELLVGVTRDAAYGARWDLVVDAAFEAIALGRSLGRPDLMGQAAAALSAYCVWLPHEWEEYFPDVVDDLRWALHHVPDDDHETRCRLQLALAVELYTNPEAAAERRALVDTGLGLARRLEDPALLAWALRAASQASWAPRWTEVRLTWDEETVTAARASGDRAAEAVALVTTAADRLELEGPLGWHEPAAAAERIAGQDRLAYVLLTISLVELNLAAMRGDAAEAERRSAMIWDLAQDSAIPGQDIQAVTGAIMSRAWDGRLPEIVSGVLHAVDHMPAQWAGLHGLLARGGYLDEVRERLVTMPFSEQEESWQTLSAWSYEAEAAYAVGDRSLAERCYAQLAPYAGRMSVGGVAIAQGPVDGYLALAAHTLGDREAAGRHAGEARRLATQWGLPAYGTWLDGHEGLQA